MPIPRGSVTRNHLDISKNELYNTPFRAMSSFYEQYPEIFDGHLVYYDPCDGLGIMSDYLEKIGKKVYRADIVNYKKRLHYKKDFLKTHWLPPDVQCIIMNPPFSLTEKFVDKALSLGKACLMFNRITTIEGKSRSRKFKDRTWPLHSFYPFGGRLTCTKGIMQEPMGSMVAYGWFYFTLSASTETTMKWIIP